MPVEQIDIRHMAVLGVLCGVVFAVIIILLNSRKHAALRRKTTTLRMAKVVSDGVASQAAGRIAGDGQAVDGGESVVDDSGSVDGGDTVDDGGSADGGESAVDGQPVDGGESVDGGGSVVDDGQPVNEQPVNEQLAGDYSGEEMRETLAVSAADVMAADIDYEKPAAVSQQAAVPAVQQTAVPAADIDYEKPAAVPQQAAVPAVQQTAVPAAAAAAVESEIIKPTDTRPLPKKKRLTETVRLKARMVLLVDDTGVNRDIIAMFFEGSGVKFDFASNGLEACEKFRQAPDKYGVILMDIQMPEMDGLEAARRIRSLEGDWAKQIPIVAMSADAHKSDIDRCFDAGMDDHIAKPVDLETLQEKVFEFVSMGME